MHKLFLVLVVTLFFSSDVFSQGLVFEDGFENHPDAVEVLSFSANPATVFEGESTSLNWILKDATSCTATDGTPQWRASVLNGTSSSFAVTTLASAGNYPFTLTCVGPIGEPSVATTNVVIIPPPVNILSFGAAPTSILEGESVTLSWTLKDAVDCTTSGGSAQWRTQVLDGRNNSVQITDLGSEGVYPFSLSCEGVAGDVASKSLEVTVQPAPTCPASTLLYGADYSWNNFWRTPDGRSFPQVGNSRIDTIIFSKGYLSIKFNTRNFSGNGHFALVNSSRSAGLRQGAISQCKGRFEAPAACRATWGTGGGIQWETDGTAGACSLQPNTTYFVNFTYTDGVDPESSRCDLSISGECHLVVDHNLGRR